MKRKLSRLLTTPPLPATTREQGCETLAVHAGREDFAALGISTPPLDLSAYSPLDSLESAVASFDALVDGARPSGNSLSARLHNPTVARFEEALAALERAEEAVAFSTGAAAMSACLLAARQQGRHVIAVRPLSGSLDQLLCDDFLDIQVSWVELDQVANAVREDTALVIFASPADPTLRLIDIQRLCRAVHPLPVLVDSTLATPVLQQPLTHGAAMVLHGNAGFLSGHGDALAGVVATDSRWAAALRRIRVATGSVLHPFTGYLLHRELATLPLRVKTAQASARLLAAELAAHPDIEQVRYPGLPEGDPENLVGSQLRGPGSVLGFTPRGGFEASTLLLESVRLVTPALGIGTVSTLIQHPAGLTHRRVPVEGRSAAGLGEGYLRLSVGLESSVDLWEDLQSALEVACNSSRLTLFGPAN